MSLSAHNPEVHLVEGNFSRIRVRKQDVVVVSSPNSLTDEEKGFVTNALQSIFPGNRALILDEGMQIGAIAVTSETEDDEDDGDGD